MNSKQAVQECDVTEQRQSPPAQKPVVQGDAAPVRLGRSVAATLPDRFLEGTAWDEV